MATIKCPVPTCDFKIGEETPDDCKNTLLQLHLTHHQSQNAQPVKPEKLKRPCLPTENSTEEWHYFLSRWENYKTTTELSGQAISAQLIECCEDQLKKDLTRVHRKSLYLMKEDDLLKAIRRLAVQEESTLVSRYNLHNMKQDLGNLLDHSLLDYEVRLMYANWS